MAAPRGLSRGLGPRGRADRGAAGARGTVRVGRGRHLRRAADAAVRLPRPRHLLGVPCRPTQPRAAAPIAGNPALRCGALQRALARRGTRLGARARTPRRVPRPARQTGAGRAAAARPGHGALPAGGRPPLSAGRRLRLSGGGAPRPRAGDRLARGRAARATCADPPALPLQQPELDQRPDRGQTGRGAPVVRPARRLPPSQPLGRLARDDRARRGAGPGRAAVGDREGALRGQARARGVR